MFLWFRILILPFFLIVYALTAKPIYAESPESFGLVAQKTLPGTTSYNFKRLKEKITEVFKLSTDAKFSYRKELLDKRVSEYVSLVESKNEPELTNASQRISYEAGILAQSIVNSKDKQNILIALFEKYKPVLAKMRDNFPANSSSWLLSQQNIDTINILSAKFK